MRRINAHHGKSLTRPGLAICEDGTIVPFKTVSGTTLTHLLEHVLLGVVVAYRVIGELFRVAVVECLDRAGMGFDMNAETVVLLLLSLIIEERYF